MFCVQMTLVARPKHAAARCFHYFLFINYFKRFQSMSNKLFFLPIALFAALVVFAPACGETDPCKDVECGANGQCDLGICVCNVGFEGAACADEWAAKFVGSYSGATSSCNPGATYGGNIERISADKIRIKEYGGFSGTNQIEATISLETASAVTATKITIDVRDDGFKRTITGTGTIVGKKLTINASINYNDGKPAETCTDVITL